MNYNCSYLLFQTLGKSGFFPGPTFLLKALSLMIFAILSRPTNIFMFDQFCFCIQQVCIFCFVGYFYHGNSSRIKFFSDPTFFLPNFLCLMYIQGPTFILIGKFSDPMFISCPTFILESRVNMRNLLEQVKKPFCYQKNFWPFTVEMNCVSDTKIFPSASNFTTTILHRTKMKIPCDISMDCKK